MTRPSAALGAALVLLAACVPDPMFSPPTGAGGDLAATPCSACPSTCSNGVCVGTPIAVGVGLFQSCALLGGGSVKCWGGNDKGQLGDGSTTDSHVPVPVTSLSSGVLSLAIGAYHACAVTAGSVACWGSNTYHRLGNTGGPVSLAPVVVAGLSPGILAVAAGGYHTCALTSAGAVQC